MKLGSSGSGLHLAFGPWLSCMKSLARIYVGEILPTSTKLAFVDTRPGGGRGGVLPYVCILGMCRERDSHFQPWISVPEHIIFSNYQKNLFRSITILHFFADYFQNFFNLNPFTDVPEIQIFSLKTDQARSGDSHIHAQKGSSSFRSPAFSSSKRLKFWSPCPFFTLPRHIPTKIWGEYPPPPPGILGCNENSKFNSNIIYVHLLSA